MPYRDPKKQKAYFEAYRKKHKARREMLCLEWRKRNYEYYINYHRERRKRQEVKERRKRLAVEYYTKNRDYILRKSKEWRNKNKGYRSPKARDSKHQRALYLKNIEGRRAWARQWAKEHPENNFASRLRRNKRSENTAEDRSKIRLFLRKVKNRKRLICYYCEQWIRERRHIDHIVPLAKGGRHVVENLCVSCPSCNQSKHSKKIEKWDKTGQQVFPI